MPVLSMREIAPDLSGTEAVFSKDQTKLALVNGQQIVVIDHTGARQVYDLGEGTAAQISFSPVGNTVLFTHYTSGPTSVKVLDLATGTLTPIGYEFGFVTESNTASYSQDASKLVFASSQRLVLDDQNGVSDIYVLDLATSVLSLVSTDATGNPGTTGSYDPMFSPDGTKVAFESDANLTGFVDNRRDIFVKFLADGAITELSASLSIAAFDPVYAPNGTFVAFAAGNGIYQRTPETGTGATIAFSVGAPPGNFDISPDSSRIAYEAGGGVFVRTIATGVTEQVGLASAGLAYLPSFSPDGNSVVFSSTSPSLLGASDGTSDRDIFIATLRAGSSVAVVGTAGDDTLEGSTFRNDLFDGGGGTDTMAGYAGDDVYIVDNPGDVVLETAQQAGDIDKVYALVSYVLPAGSHIEELTTSLQSATTAIDLTGNEFANNVYGNDGTNVLRGEGGNDQLFGYRGNDELFGGDGNDTLFGGAGFDLLTGGAGDDVYVMEDLADTIIEAVGGGNDTVYAAFSFNLAPGQEIETLSTGGSSSATTALSFTGNEFGNTLYANNGANNLVGGGGDDSLFGLGGADSLFGGDGNDKLHGGRGAGGDGSDALFGGDGNDELYGGIYSDLLDGGLGADVMSGGSGDDIYIVDDAGDTIIDGPQNYVIEGDRVLATVSYVLTAGAPISVLAAAGSDPNAAIDLTGNEYNNNIWGNEGANTLNGGLGNDWLFGFGGDDVLDGGAGNDFLIAGAGTDSLTGGDGNDVIQLDDTLDTAFEAASGGYDTLYVNFSYSLAAGQEFEVLSTGGNAGATTAITLEGNEFGQIVSANDGENIVNGMGGDDRLFGLNGADVLDGGEGVDRLYGGAGADTLTGGADGDFFFFDAPLTSADTITDFVSGSDAIMLARSQFGGIAEGAFPDRTFATGSAATDPSHRIVYDSATGWVYFDEDGVGGVGAVHFLTVAPGTSLAASDFFGY